MNWWRWLAVGISLLLVVIYAGGSAYWVDSASGWYLSLRKPSWQPPDFVFGLIWPYNFLVLGAALVLIAVRLPVIEVVIAFVACAVTVALALLWSYMFYVRKAFAGAAIPLIAACALTPVVVLYGFRASGLVGWLLLPYQIWLGLAAALSTSYARLN